MTNPSSKGKDAKKDEAKPLDVQSDTFTQVPNDDAIKGGSLLLDPLPLPLPGGGDPGLIYPLPGLQPRFGGGIARPSANPTGTDGCCGG
jgi:hypothetical protein